jgi:uncharacterized protein
VESATAEIFNLASGLLAIRTTGNIRQGRSSPLKARLLDLLTDLCLRHSRRILVVAFLIGLASLGAASKLRFDPDILNLVPQHNKEINDFRRVLAEMGTIDHHIAVITIPEGQDVAEYETLIEEIGEGYGTIPLLESVEYRLPDPADLIDTILPRSMLFLTPAELDLVAARLSDAGIREAVQRNKALLQTPQATAMKDVIQYDPFNLLPIYLEKIKRASGGISIDASSGYYLSDDHSMLLIITKPKQPAQDIPFGQELLERAEEIERIALARFASENPAIPLPTVAHAGGYAIAQGDTQLIRKDVISNVLFSVCGVLLVFFWGFRRIAAIGYAGLPLVLGLAMTFGLAGLTFGELSSASAGFAALLAGLGVDFIMVLYGRYVDERNRGSEMPEALRAMIHSTLPGVFIAATTTAATFFGFLATDFRGMSQLGFLTGIGILLFFLSVIFVLPALLVEGEKKGRKQPRLYHHSFGTTRLIDFSVRRPKTTIAAWMILLAVTGVMATQLEFSDNLQDLRSKDNTAVILQEQLTEKFGQAFDFMMYVVEGSGIDETVERTVATLPSLDRLVSEGTLASYQSVATFVPPQQQQREIIEALAAGSDDRFNVARIESTFRSELQREGFRPDAWDGYLELFGQALTVREPISLAAADSEAIERLTGRFLHTSDDGTTMSVVYLYPANGRWPRVVPPSLRALETEHPGTTLTGVNLVSEVMRVIVRADAIRATSLSLFLVFVLLLIGFRSLWMALLVFVPFVAGAVAMLGFMAAFGLPFNFMNIFVGLMIIGVATDYSIYMLKRYLEGPSWFADNARETGKAVSMAAVTSIVGYGSFAISSYPGLRSIGYASTLGIGLSGLAAITLLPAVLILGVRTVRSRRKVDLEHDGLVPAEESIESEIKNAEPA